MRRVPSRRHPSPAPLAVTLAALISACSSASSTPGPDLSVCDAAGFQTLLNAVPPSGGGGPGTTSLKVHYHRDDGAYTGWVLHAWKAAVDPGWAVGYPVAGTDAFGVYYTPTLSAAGGDVGYIFHQGDTKDLPGDQNWTLGPGANEVWRLSGDPVTYTCNPQVPACVAPRDLNRVRVHYLRFDGAYDQWGLHLLPGGGADPAGLAGLTLGDWSNPVALSAMPAYAAAPDGSEVVFDLPVLNPKDGASRTRLEFVVHGLPSNPAGGVENKDGWSSNIVLSYSSIVPVNQLTEIWLVQENPTVFTGPPDLGVVSTTDARAHWLTKKLLKFPNVGRSGTFKLHYSGTGQILAKKGFKVIGADGALALDAFTAAVPGDVAARFKFVSGGVVLTVKDADEARLPTLHKAQLVVTQEDGAGNVLNASTAQVAGALDDLYAAGAAVPDLGATVVAGQTRFKLWAPTAQKVSVCLYDTGSGTASGLEAMTFDASTGVWSAVRPSDLSGKYYKYVSEVFVRGVGLVRNLVTDPYSLSLTTDSKRSYVADLAKAALLPAGWSTVPDPATAPAQIDMVVYELHVRDFSANDLTVPLANRGRYLAFTDTGSNGMTHLRSLAQAGVTDVHLLPVFDIASAKEDPAQRVDLDSPFPELCTRASGVAQSTCDANGGKTIREVLATYGAADERQQAVVNAMKELDGFNWGYDPYHFTAPEGSYASDAADGAKRVVEFRQMVLGLKQAGLRVGMDVVYNHTTGEGQAENSVLDRVVPGYYHRLDGAGAVTRSTCCSNTATEHMMMEKLMSDSAVTWATQYRIDSFRFDLMGHQPRAAMERLKARVNAAAGRTIHLIGEGWNFGEVQDGARFVQASQLSLGGSGIAAFSDRARDRIRGGSPFDSGADLIKNQGYVNGLVYDRNPSATAATMADLHSAADMVRVGLAGSVRDFSFTTYEDTVKTLLAMDYNGQPAGFASEPSEVVNYVENHDNQTLFDINAYKLPTSTSQDDRARVQLLAAALNALSQGVAYFHAGVETLRSKSMDRNSYNSGDWFNRLDWTFSDNYFGVGAPPIGDNQASYPQLKPLLAVSAIKPGAASIQQARDGFLDLLAIRKSSTLFRLRTAADVKVRLTFPNTGSSGEPTVVMGHLDGAGYAGAVFQEALYAVNVDKVAHTITLDAQKDRSWTLHPVQAAVGAADQRPRTQASYASVSGAFTVPPRTTVVWVVN